MMSKINECQFNFVYLYAKTALCYRNSATLNVTIVNLRCERVSGPWSISYTSYVYMYPITLYKSRRKALKIACTTRYNKPYCDFNVLQSKIAAADTK